MLNENFCVHDNIMDNIDFEELMTTVQSNCEEVNEKTITEAYREILKMKLQDAEYMLKANMENILKECRRC